MPAAGAAAAAQGGSQVDEDVGNLLEEWRVALAEHEERMAVVDGEVAAQDRTGWFKRTGWPEHLAGCNTKHLAAAAALPGRQEEALQRVVAAVDAMIEQSVAGLSTLGLETRRWLRSPKRGEVDVRPLSRLQNRASQQRYAGYWKQFVCYALRVIMAMGKADAWHGYFPDSDGTSSGAEVVKGRYAGHNEERLGRMKDACRLFRWSRVQQAAAMRVLLRAAVPDQPQEKLVQALLVLAKYFILDTVGDRPFNSGLVYFLAVLGINLDIEQL